MVEKHFNDKELDALFDVTKDMAPNPPADLVTRILREATAVQAGFAAPRVSARPPGLWREIFRLLGGWPAMAGLATATVAGVWLGAYLPGFLPDVTAAFPGAEDASYLIDTASGLGFDLGEEAL